MIRRYCVLLIILLCLVNLVHCAPSTTSPQTRRSTPVSATKTFGYRVVRAFPHDSSSFTQGLEYREGVLYEGTGLEGRSKLRKVELETGRVIQDLPLEHKYFGEGITVMNRQVVQLTWKTQIGFVYDQGTFRLIRSFNYPGEGWGLANDGIQIYMSDGTPDIRILDPVTFQEKRRMTVRDGAQSVRMLNELEFVRGELYSNVWQTDRIARISPSDGKVTGWIDLTGILTPQERIRIADDGGVLNGIAFDQLGNRLFVTGKLWPKVFEIQLIEQK